MDQHDDRQDRDRKKSLNNAAKAILIVLGLMLLGCLIFVGGCFGMFML